MTLYVDALLTVPTCPVVGLLNVHGFTDSAVATTLPSGSLRIGGDAPNGLVLAGAAPAARTVDLFDRELRLWVATTVSASDGTYAFTSLCARTEGYDVCIRGAAGERDVWLSGVHPG